MFESLPHTFRAHGLKSDVRTLLLLRKAMERDLAQTVGDLYVVLKGMVCSTPEDFGPFTAAFYEYFLAIDVKKGERLESAVLRSKTFQDWKKDQFEDLLLEEKPNMMQMVDTFLDEIHSTTFDIQKHVSGADILEKDNPHLEDKDPQSGESEARTLDKMADYTDISLEELMRRMEEVAKQQKSKHSGGSHWIGQGGISPYGNGGAAAGGIRVGGQGGGKLARAVMNDSRFFPADVNAILRDDNIDAALAALKGIEDESTEMLLDIPTTIREGIKQGAIFLPHIKEKIEHKVQVLLLIDNGGYSMTPYVQSVQKLFAKMKTRFAHDLKTYYFHNTMYGGAYSDVRRSQFVPIEKIADDDKNYSVFIMGDADMAPYELDRRSMATWKALEEAYKRIAWLNPSDERWWSNSMTISVLHRTFPMFPLTPAGIEKAVASMNQKKR